MRFLLSLFIAATLATLANAYPPVSLVPIESQNVAGCAHAMTGAATYAFNQSITGSTSAAIDLGLVGCFSFSVTSTAGGQSLRIWQSSSSTSYTASTTVSAGTIVATFLPGGPNQQACYSFTKLGGRYVWFDIPGLSPNLGGPNFVTPTASKYSVWYYTPTNWPN